MYLWLNALKSLYKQLSSAPAHLNKFLMLSVSCGVVPPEGELSAETQHHTDFSSGGHQKIHCFLFWRLAYSKCICANPADSRLCPGKLSGSLLWALLFTAQSRCENPHSEIFCPIQLWVQGGLGTLSQVYAGNTRMCLTISKAKCYRKCILQQQMYLNFKNVLKLIVK